MEDKMLAECHHIFPDGHRCGSPALRGEPHCYYHDPKRSSAHRRRRTRYTGMADLLPSLDSVAGDPTQMRLLLSAVLQALAENSISLYKAQTIIYALQLATNLNNQ